MKKDTKFALMLLLPTALFLVVLVLYPMINNIIISFQQVPINPKIPAVFIGFKNYLDVLKDSRFYNSLFLTIIYTSLTVVGSTALGLGVALMFNRKFKFRGIVRSLVILSYVTPSISLIFTWKYMFNNTYGITNYLMGDIMGLFKESPLWFDNEILSFVVVVLFAIWRFFPYAFISFLAILQTLDKTLYEAARIDGANVFEQFKAVTLPAIMPVLATVLTLRTIWMFYMFSEVYLLTTKVNIIGVYLYESAFAVRNLGKAAAISVILFFMIFSFIIMIRKKVNIND